MAIFLLRSIQFLPVLRVDRDLGLLRVRAKPLVHSEFISVKSIVRGALLVEDFDKPGDYLVVDTTDGDMFLQCKALLRLSRQ
ncbi:hypothetical protein OF83DRAFT_1180860 [Amylostereum chailletii]|nr:hypothetical protein OF83DRAFT_1180860 [Amylostereum chailletii]